MMAAIVLGVVAVFLVAYRFYGQFLSREVALDDKRTTPAVEFNDGNDFVPAKASLLLPQHFSAIAAAGPIVGPILAGMWFGWVPAILWIIFGAIFIGGVHDFLSMIASVRNKGESIGEIIKQCLPSSSYYMFLGFVWITLVYVIIAFTDITAQSFVVVAKGEAMGPGVAAASILYLLLGLAMGVALKAGVRLWILTAIFVPLVFTVIVIGASLPPSVMHFMLGMPVKAWEMGLLGYCFIAALLPMWLLLQPRGYLGGWFLYITLAIGLLGALFGGYAVQYPAFNLAGFTGADNGKWLFPALFITIACGAVSGFHGVVSSGTTSKQIRVEGDVKTVAYGGMLLEGVVALLALATLMMLPKGDTLLKSDPNIVYATGLATYMGRVGIGFNLALTFALVAFATFVYDTLDVCTRLARYILQELLGWKSRAGAVGCTALTLLPALAFLMMAREKAYALAWPTFGTSNQLMASLTLLGLSVWLLNAGRRAWYVLAPLAFILAATMTSLVLLVLPFYRKISGAAAGAIPPDTAIAGVVGSILLLLSAWLVISSLKTMLKKSAA